MIIVKKNNFFKILLGKILIKFLIFFNNLKWKSYYFSSLDKFAYIGRNVILDNEIWFGGRKNITIKDNVFIGKGVIINAAKGGSIYLDKGCSIGANSTIITWNLDNYKNKSLIRANNKNIFKGVFIGKGVGIGYNVTINPGVKLEDGCEVAAGSVVTRDVKAFDIVAGNPAVVVGKRVEI
jgi:acetyltransferase-like isoleucine patch superfamily enzyme